MKAATQPVERSSEIRLLVADAGGVSHHRRKDLPRLLRRGDLVIANDAATLPASLTGVHVRTGVEIEVRLAGRDSLAPAAVRRFTAVVFGPGDYRTPTERRALPPSLQAGDELMFGSLRASVMQGLGHPRVVALQFHGAIDAIWETLARRGRPIQYSYVPKPLDIWDTWTRVAGQPVAFEPPSAGFVLDWSMLHAIRARGVRFATITHAAGISSTGDAELDRLLPFDEAYAIPASTAALLERARAAGGRVIAIGTTVVRALEAAADADGRVRPGEDVATGRIGPDTDLRVVDALVSGMHEPGTSHYELLKAFIGDEELARMTAEAEAGNYRAHEFGDCVFIVRPPRMSWRPAETDMARGTAA